MIDIKTNRLLARGLTACFIVVLSVAQAFGQGSWDMLYLPLDSINSSLLGKEVRVDFKQSELDNYSKRTHVRRLLSKRDTVSIQISEKNYLFVEQWKFYVDHGVLKEQTLGCVDEKWQADIYIKEVYLKGITDQFFNLEVKLYSKESSSPKSLEKITIPKSQVKGVLIRIPDK